MEKTLLMVCDSENLLLSILPTFLLLLFCAVLLTLALIMFDLGALQLLSNIQKIILVTDDHFGGAAKGCFADDTLTDVFQDISTITSNTISKYSAVDFQVVPNCLSAARLVGRLWF